VLNVSISYLLMPPPGSGPIEYEPGVIAEPAALERALDIYRGTGSQEEAFAEWGNVFFEHLGQLRELIVQIQQDLDNMVRAMGMPRKIGPEGNGS
jgi:hypothetical protein